MAVTGFRRLGAAALAAALGLQATAANAICLTDHEAKSVALFLSPDIIVAMAKTCRPLLPAGAYLARPDDALAGRFRASATAAWPSVRSLAARIPDAKMFKDMDEATARGLVRLVAFGPQLLGKIKPGDCSLADQLLAPLEPLPPDNMASFIVALGRLGEAGGLNAHVGGSGGKEAMKPSIFCGAPPVPKSATIAVPIR